MKKIVYLFPLLFSISIFGQEEATKAEPISGVEKFYEDFMDEFNTDSLNIVDGEQMKFMLQFVVDRDGTIIDIKIIEGDQNALPEIKRVFSVLPKWKPAQVSSRTLKSAFYIPIVINNKNDLSENQ